MPGSHVPAILTSVTSTELRLILLIDLTVAALPLNTSAQFGSQEWLSLPILDSTCIVLVLINAIIHFGIVNLN